MSFYDIKPDAPGLLRAESLNTNIKLDRTSESTARISWNIPVPATGCAAGDQAYCGMVVTVDTKPVSVSGSPINGTVYNSDPSASPNLHVGDKIGTALVVGAFYNDRTTVVLDINGLSPNTPYYVSGYPTDCQFRYFREGIHAYSLDYTTNGTDSTSSSQVVLLSQNTDPTGVSLSEITGLDPAAQYEFKIQLGVIAQSNRPVGPQECVPTPPTYDIVVDGANVSTYGNLLNAINKQLSLIDSPVQGSAPPYAGTYVLTGTPKTLYMWDGFTHSPVPVIQQTAIPNIVITGNLWFDPATLVLKTWNGTAWTITNYLSYDTDPTQPICNQTVWLNGTTAFRWDGTTWCSEVLYNQPTNPSIVTIECGAYWYNTDTNFLYSWNEHTLAWVSVDAIQSTVNPNALPANSHWYNEQTSQLLVRSSTNTWLAIPNVRYTEQEPTTPMAGTLWYKQTENELRVRSILNDAWSILEVISYPTDPTMVASCSLWWKDLNGVATLYVWNASALAWVVVTNFYQQSSNPELPPNLSQGTLWIDGHSIINEWDNNCFKPVTVIYSTVDPVLLPDGTIWYNTTTKTLMLRASGVWNALAPILTSLDPTNIPMGTFWFNAQTSMLSAWNGVSWVVVGYNSTLVTPSNGLKWYNTVTNILYAWNGIGYVHVKPLVTLELNCNRHFIFTHTLTGSLSFVRLHDVTLFKSLNVPFSFDSTTPGSDGVSNQLSYLEEGIGTDGSADERLRLSTEIRMALGYPSVEVELTPEQIDLAITMALSELRSKSSVAYKHAYFFMRTIGNEQKYYLTNKIQGMHKIVTVLGVQRLTSSFLSSAHGAGVYGQVILQQLYNMGNFDILTYHLQAEYIKTLEIMFAGRVTFTWDEHRRELFLHSKFPFSERVVLIEATVERTEQDIINDRWSKEWIRRFSTAKCKEMLSQIRGKYSSLPGAGGNVSFNASDLAQQAAEEIRTCHEEIEDYVVDNLETLGYTCGFVFG